MLDGFNDWLLEREKRERTSHYASDATDCRRKLYYKWTDEPVSNPITPGALLKMKMGNAVEIIVADYLYYLREQGQIETVDEQYKIKTEIPGLEYPISIAMDFVIDRKFILEIKSSYGRGIVEIQKKQQPKTEHLMQCWMYLHYSDFDELQLVYFGRDNGYRTEFWLRETENGITANKKEFAIADPVIKFKQIEQAVQNKEIPKRDYLAAIKNGEIRDKFQKEGKIYKTKWQCNYCSWRDTCWQPVVRETTVDNSEMFTEGS